MGIQLCKNKGWKIEKTRINPKELSFCHKLKYSYPFIFAYHGHDLRYFKLLILLDQIIDLKYQRFTLSGCRDIKIRKFEYEAKTQIL